MRQKHFMDQIFGWLLFAVFAICSLLLVAAGAGSYKRTAKKMSTTGSAVVVSYLTEKLRHADWDSVIIEDEQTLRIQETVNGTECEIWIYPEDGELCESILPVGREPVRGAGNPIAQIEDYSIESENRMIRFTVTDILGEERTRLFFYPRINGDQDE